MKIPREKIVCLDFDGVVHGSQTWKAGRPEGEPTEGALEFIEELHEEGYEIIISSAHVNEEGDIGASTEAILGWLEEYGFPYGIAVTGEKPVANWYIDDRAIRFRGDFDRVKREMDEPVWTDGQEN